MSEFLNITGMETNTCNILRDNLHDRYDSGFPILKELIQNANDANASVLKISKHNGIFNATHPLLQKKALIIYNDGEVNENDLKGIVTVARGGKTGRSGVIGKFGLGMKSIFHFCDMFFYYAFVNGKEEIKAVNPFVSFATGKDDYHQDWNDFPESDRDLIKKNIIEVIGNQKKGLILWIPLRDDSYKYRIVKDIYKIENLWAGTDQNDSEYLKKNVALSLAALEISTPCNQSFRSLELISIETQEHPLIIEFKKNTNLITSNGEDYCLANKSGIIEDHEGEKKLKTLIEKDKFSKISDIDENGEEKEISLFSTGQKVSIAVAKFINSNEKSITFNWCSYLPLNSKIADQTKKYENLDGEYHLLIHANFAIDSGRRNIVEYSDCIDKSKDINLENVSDDKTSQIMWNMILIRNFIFTNLLKVVCSYKLSNLFYENLIDYITSEKSDFGCFCFTNGFIYKKDNSEDGILKHSIEETSKDNLWDWQASENLSETALSFIQKVNEYYSEYSKEKTFSFYEVAAKTCNYIKKNLSVNINWCVLKVDKRLNNSDLIYANKLCANNKYPFLYLPLEIKENLENYEIIDVQPVINFLLKYKDSAENKVALFFASLFESDSISQELCKKIYTDIDIKHFIPLFELRKIDLQSTKYISDFKTYDQICEYSKEFQLFTDFGITEKNTLLHKYSRLFPSLPIYLISEKTAQRQLFLSTKDNFNIFRYESDSIKILDSKKLTSVLFSMNKNLQFLNISEENQVDCNDIIHEADKLLDSEISEFANSIKSLLLNTKDVNIERLYVLDCKSEDTPKAKFYLDIFLRYSEYCKFNNRVITLKINISARLLELLDIEQVDLSKIEFEFNNNISIISKCSSEEKDLLAEYITREDIYKKLPISKTVDEKYVSLDSNIFDYYLQSKDEKINFPNQYKYPQNIKIILRNKNDTIQKTIRSLTAKDVVNIILLDEENLLGCKDGIILSNWLLDFIVTNKIRSEELYPKSFTRRWIPGFIGNYYSLQEIIDNKLISKNIVEYCENVIDISNIDENYKSISYLFSRDINKIWTVLLSHNKKEGKEKWPWFNLSEFTSFKNIEDKKSIFQFIKNANDPALVILSKLYNDIDDIFQNFIEINSDLFISDEKYLSLKYKEFVEQILQQAEINAKCNETEILFIEELFSHISEEDRINLINNTSMQIKLPSRENSWQDISNLVNFENELPDLSLQNQLHVKLKKYFPVINQREGTSINTKTIQPIDFFEKIFDCKNPKLWGCFCYIIANNQERAKLYGYSKLLELETQKKLNMSQIPEYKTDIIIHESKGNYCFSLTNKRIELSDSSEITSVFYNPPKIEQDRLLIELFDNFLQFSAENVESAIKQLLNLSNIVLDNQFFNELGNPSQAPLEDATNLIFDNIVSTLKELKLQKHLGKYDLISSEIDAYKIAAKNKDSNSRLKSIERIQKLIEDDKGNIHQAIRNKVIDFIKRAEYSERCILFELFQNADDAYKQKKSDCPYFDVSKSDSELRITHEGRPINESQVGGYDVYKEDLVNMLRIGWSDKESLYNITGKFGYGFKTVYLICDEPIIKSGEYYLKIRAGLYPESLLQEADYTKKTEIILELNENGKRNETKMIAEFENFAKYQVLFAKEINQIRINGKIYKWSPVKKSQILEDSKFEIHEDDNFLLLKTVPRNITDKIYASFAFRKNANGNELIPFDSDAPKVWCMAPLKDYKTINFAINADFKTNTGRQTLAIDNEDNKKLISVLANLLGECLEEMYLNSEYTKYVPTLINLLLDSKTKTKSDKIFVFEPFSNIAISISQKLKVLPDGAGNIFEFNKDKKLYSFSSSYFNDKINKQYEMIQSINAFIKSCASDDMKIISRLAADLLPQSSSIETIKVIDVIDKLLNKYSNNIQRQKKILENLSKNQNIYDFILQKKEELSSCLILDANEHWKSISEVFEVSSHYGNVKAILKNLFRPSSQAIDNEKRTYEQEISSLQDEIEELKSDTSVQNNVSQNNRSFNEIYNLWQSSLENGNWNKLLDEYYNELFPTCFVSSSLIEDFELVNGCMPENWTCFLLLAMCQSLVAWGHSDSTNKNAIEWLSNVGLIKLFSNGEDLQILYDKYLEKSTNDESRLRHFECLLRVYKIRKKFEEFYNLLTQLPLKQNLTDLTSFLAVDMDPELSGFGISISSSKKSLRLGISMIVRELLRCSFWEKNGYNFDQIKQLQKFAYMPKMNICKSLNIDEKTSDSQFIYNQIKSKIVNSEFLKYYDLPFYVFKD